MERAARLANNVGAAHPNRTVSSKYTAVNFLPLNLYHQLSKHSTLFFFVTLILLCIPAISPFAPWPYMLAFLIVVGISMAKDGIEDYRRHVSDRAVNEAECCVLRNKIRTLIAVEDLSKGDLLCASKHGEIPADVVLLHGTIRGRCATHCFIDTSNLDGESNLKKRVSPLPACHCSKRPDGQEGGRMDASTNLQIDTFTTCRVVRDFTENVRSFRVEDTGDTFSEFHCSVEMVGDDIAVNEKNVLLRGSILRNTDTALCLVVAIGSETKQYRSVAKARKGKSLFEKKMDSILLIIALIYAVMLVSTTAVGVYSVCTNRNIIYINRGSRVWQITRLLFSNYILYSYLIPLSLYVMIEVSRFFHALYIRYDRSLKIDGVKSVCRNSNVIEDLGTIDYVLTDKTGTITKNAMTLRALHVKGSPGLLGVSEVLSGVDMGSRPSGGADVHTGADSMSTVSDGKRPAQAPLPENSLFLLVMNLLVCNSVEVLNGHYEGVSQDELCFLEGLRDHGCALLERSEHSVVIEIKNRRIAVDILHTTEFTSKRQCMATLVRLNGRPLLLVKGSDQRLLDPRTDSHLLSLFNSAADYRSLIMAAKPLTEAEAEKMVDGKEDAYRHVAEAAYCGATFIEDELQDDVSKTMADLRSAGIKVWMVTGDKKETALSCARSSGIVGGEGVFLAVEGRDVVSALEREATQAHPRSVSAGSVISRSGGGRAQHSESSSHSTINNSINKMFHARNNNRTDPSLCEDSSLSSGLSDGGFAGPGSLFDSDGIVIYRTTPSQKGRIAELMAKAGRSILAIGDGNNDVAMLKDAHVGVGIIGREGTQAALAADFAIPQFRLLRNLILVHGRYNLIRYSKVAVNAYYKNLVFIAMQYFYNFYNGASGRSIYNNFFMNYYNLFFTSLIPFSIALFDRDQPPEDILRTPQSYKAARRYFSKPVVWANLLFAVLEGAAIFFTLRAFIYFDISGSSGRLGGYSCVSTLFSIVVFFTVILRQINIISYAVSYTYAAIALSIFFNFIVLFGVQEIGKESNAVIYHILGMPVVYFAAAGVCGAVYTIDCVFEWVISRLMLK